MGAEALGVESIDADREEDASEEAHGDGQSRGAGAVEEGDASDDAEGQGEMEGPTVEVEALA